MPHTTRRRFLLLVGIFASALTLFGAVLFGRRRRPRRDLAPLSPGEQAILSRYLDLLIPADEAPGALDLGVSEQLFQRAAGNDYLRDLLHRGCAWLEQQPSGFLALSEHQQLALIAASEQSDPDSLPYRLFERLRHFSFQAYYSDARSWGALGYHRPPQPLGFPDYQQPPASDLG